MFSSQRANITRSYQFSTRQNIADEAFTYNAEQNNLNSFLKGFCTRETGTLFQNLASKSRDNSSLVIMVKLHKVESNDTITRFN